MVRVPAMRMVGILAAFAFVSQVGLAVAAEETTKEKKAKSDPATAQPGGGIQSNKAKAMLPAMEKQDAAQALVTTLKLEKEINTFFRLTSPSVIAGLRAAFPDLPDNPDPKTVFVKLRELRNKW